MNPLPRGPCEYAGGEETVGQCHRKAGTLFVLAPHHLHGRTVGHNHVAEETKAIRSQIRNNNLLQRLSGVVDFETIASHVTLNDRDQNLSYPSK